VRITRAGEQIVARARRVLVQVDDLIAAATGARDPFTGTFRIGVIPTVAPYLLPDVTPALARAYPKLRLVLLEEKTDEVMRDLREGKLDAGLLALGDDLSDFEHAIVLKDPFVVALPKDHPLAKQKRIALGDLEATSVLLLDDGHCFRSQALALCAKAGARETDVRATSLATLVQMVATGAGVTLLPTLALAVENRRAQLDVRPFVGPVPSRTLALVWRRGSPFADAFRELATALRTAAAH
jgi:LysR family hydrogen peroxide-inducible transcriptional activator